MKETSKMPSRRTAIRAAAIFAAAFILQGMTFYAIYDTGGSAGEGVRGTNSVPQQVITQTFVVDNPGDDGQFGSLRWAIEQANASPGRDRIQFAFTEPEGITITLNAPLPPIEHGVIIDGGYPRPPTPPIGPVPIPYPNIDGRHVSGDLIVITATHGTLIRGLRLLNASGASAVAIHNGTNTTLKDNFIDLSTRGIFVHGSEGITLTNNVLSRIGTQGITFADGVRFADVITNTVSVIRGSGIVAAGNPAPDNLFIKGIVITATTNPILFGPGVNQDFPAPQIDGAIRVITQTLRGVPPQLILDVSSTASPELYVYPLTFDLYRVRGNSYVPMGRSFAFGADLFPGPVGITLTLAATQFSLDDRFALLASTADRRTSEVSDPQPLVLQVDDTTPPECELASINRENGKAVSITIHARDAESGVARIDVERARNAQIEIPAGSGNWFVENESAQFDPPETELIEILGAKIDVDAGAQIALAVWDDAGNVTRCDPVVATLTSSEVPERLHIEQNYPNPFNPETVINFQIPEASYVTLSVFDMLGREIAILVEGTHQAGTYSVRWDGRNQSGVPVPSGVYVYRLTVGMDMLERAMILAR